MTHTLMDESFFDRLRSHPRPVVVDIWAPWCFPCRAISPALDKLGQEYTGKVDVWKVNADEQPELVRALGIYSIPTLIVFRGDSEISRKIGAQPQPVLAGLFETALGRQTPLAHGPAALERFIRLAAGTALIFLGWTAGHSLVLLVLGAAVLFSAVYDRCPVWRAISPRLAGVIRQVFHQPPTGNK